MALVIIHCAYCDKKKKIKPAEKRERNFCNHQCCGQWRSLNLRGENNGRWTGGNIVIECANCGREKEIPRSRKKQDNYCSFECRGPGYSKNRVGGNNPKWSRVEVRCAWCNKPKNVQPSEKRERNFCDRKCMAEWKKENVKGANHPNWLGGKSFEPYGLGFNDALKETIRDRDGRTCRLCGEKENGRALDVHHIDYNKKNNSEDNLAALCKSCHMQTRIDRETWIERLTDGQLC